MKSLLGFLLLFSSFVAKASTPVFTLTPVGTLPTEVNVGLTVSLSYTVTNNTSYTLTNNGLRYAPTGQTPIGVTQAAGGCSNPFTLAAGASCTLNLLVTADDLVDSVAIGGPEVCNTLAYPAHCSIPIAADQLNITATIVPFHLSLAVGQDTTGTQPPYFVQSADDGSTWSAGTIPGTTPTGLFLSSGCSDTICVAVGQKSGTSGYIIYTVSDGVVWREAPLTGVGFQDASCVSAFCVAVGVGGATPLLTQTQDNGLNWNTIAQPGDGLYRSTSCSDSICIAGGGTAITAPSLVQTTVPLGNSWTSVSGLPADGAFFSTSCSGMLCIAVGESSTFVDGFMMRTANAGVSWDSVPSLNLTLRPLDAVSCNGSTCVAGGFTCNDSGCTLPASLLLVSTNSGVSWVINPTGFTPTNNSRVQSVSCSDLICVAVGNHVGGGIAFIRQSTNGGSTWSTVAASFLTANTQLEFVECSEGFCITGGRNVGTNELILGQTLNTGSSWSSVTGVTFPATGLFSGGTASTALNHFSDEMFYFRNDKTF